MTCAKAVVIGLGPKLDTQAWRTQPLSCHNPEAFYREAVARCFSPNIGCIAVASYLESHGWSVDYIELALEFGIPLREDAHTERYNKLADKFCQSKYIAVFVSCISASEERTLFDVCRTVREQLPQAALIVGGYHASARASMLIHQLDVDLIVVGDFEPLFPAIASYISGRNLTTAANDSRVRLSRGTMASSIAASKKIVPHSVRIRYGVAGHYFSLYDMLGTIASKGCAYDCGFCQERQMRGYYFNRPVQDVLHEVAEIASLSSQDGNESDRVLYFLEPMFGLRRSWLEEFCEAVSRETTFPPWAFQTRIGSMNRDDIQLVASAGCSLISFGLEAFSPKILYAMNKTRNADDYLARFRLDIDTALDVGLSAQYNVLYGYPGETKETLAYTEQCIEETKSDYPTVTINLNLFRAIPGTHAYAQIGTYWGSRHLISDWWTKPIIPGITITALPSDKIEVRDLLEFLDRMYDDDFCYRRDGVPLAMEKYLTSGRITKEELHDIAQVCRKKALNNG
jgi:radical SAM superfamily enzyme YgiQ (UPF0313 family)